MEFICQHAPIHFEMPPRRWGVVIPPFIWCNRTYHLGTIVVDIVVIDVVMTIDIPYHIIIGEVKFNALPLQ